MSQTIACLCVLALVTSIGCAEEPATVSPDGGRIGATDNTPKDAGGGSATGKVDAGLDGGRDARIPDDEDEGEVVDASVQAPTVRDAGRRVDASTQESSFKLSSPDVTARALLPDMFRCKDAVSPALSWTPGPAGTQSYAVQLRDIEAVGGLRSYWLIFDLPADVTTLPRMIPRRENVEQPPARQALDDSRLGFYGYRGPCAETTLELSVHALDVAALPDIAPDASAAVIGAAISEHELSKATMVVESAVQGETDP